MILRLYKSISEVLHGFDVDGCALGFDGKDIWMTRRCWYALKNGFNTVNFNRASPSYVYRLCKYAKRGLPIYLEGFDRSLVDEERLTEVVQGEKNRISYNQALWQLVVDTVDKLPDHLKINYWGFKKTYCKGYRTRIFVNNRDTSIKLQRIFVTDLERVCMLESLGFYDDMRDLRKKVYSDNTSTNYDGLAKILLLEGLDHSLTKDNYESYVSKNIEEHDYSGKNFRCNYSLSSIISKRGLSKYYRKNSTVKDLIFELHLDNDPNDKVNFIVDPNGRRLHDLLYMNEEIYDLLREYRGFNFTRRIVFKKINPGEQATSTFNVQVIEDPAVFFDSDLYNYYS